MVQVLGWKEDLLWIVVLAETAESRFKTAALNHSAIPPLNIVARVGEDTHVALLARRVITIDDAVLHHEEHLFGQADVLRGVAGHGDDVGEFPHLQRADAGLHAEQLGVGRGAGAERVERAHAQRREQVELFDVAAVRIHRGVVPMPMRTPLAMALRTT